MVDLLFAVEKLGEVVRVLATHPAAVRFRLLNAYPAFALVPRAALPTRLQTRYDEIVSEMTSLQPGIPGLGRLDYTLRSIRVKTRVRLAEEIVALDAEVRAFALSR